MLSLFGPNTRLGARTAIHSSGEELAFPRRCFTFYFLFYPVSVQFKVPSPVHSAPIAFLSTRALRLCLLFLSSIPLARLQNKHDIYTLPRKSLPSFPSQNPKHNFLHTIAYNTLPSHLLARSTLHRPVTYLLRPSAIRTSHATLPPPPSF